ncbi:zinc-binding dehydrogenase [Leifsonia sp. 2TAF2]|uniref:zinc-binding dehydrogenase n=1 Tax=Leifsonia sp. 2TAF2 TaxID=3233009 RepID=UPI003F975BE4
MRAVIIEEFGDASGMRVVERETPVVPPGHVLIRTEAIGVGGVDAVIRRGTVGSVSAAGMIPGSEVAGTVVSVGAGVDDSWIGRRVWAFTGISGGYAEFAVAHVDDLSVIPSGLSSSDAATLGSAATVAHFALAHARFRSGESVLVRGAAGSIGIAAIELAVRGGASAVAATTASSERGRRLRERGATHILDRAGQGDGEAPDVFDVIIDIAGGAEVPAFLDRLAPNGRFVLVGAVAGFPPPDFGLTLLRSFQQSRSFATFSLATIPVAERNQAREELLRLAARGELSAVVDEILPLEEAPEAHRRMDDGSVFGRIVLVPTAR